METQDELVESKKYAALGEIVAGVAHQINTPLGNSITSISYSFTILQNLYHDLKKNELSRQKLEACLKSLDESYSIVLSNLKRVEHTISKFKVLEVSLISDNVDFINIHEEVLSSLEKLGLVPLDQGSIKIDLKFENSLIVNASKKWIDEIVKNLINNSLVHGFNEDENGLITIIGKRVDDSKIRIVYEDNGVGISESEIHRVFDPFHSGHQQSKNLGLGLSIVYNIVVRKLSGSIELESIEGEYTRFIIEFPE